MTLAKNEIEKIVRMALKEDAAFHDLTTRVLIPPKTKTVARILAKQDLVLCGLPLAKQAFSCLDPGIRFKTKAKEGDWVKKGSMVVELFGPARGILSAERVALNFLQSLSGVATLTREYVQKVKGTRAKVLDTRKTIPGLREVQRYAVRVGGGQNHRFDLSSGVMAKDNHVAVVGSISDTVRMLKDIEKKVPKVMEVENLQDLRIAIKNGARYVQLDNMSVSQLKSAVRLGLKDCKLEATGGITLENIQAVAKTGVDYISVGALTHSAPAVDLSLEFR